MLAPNYPAGKDSLAGFKRYYKGNISGEVYTKLGQSDYAAELAALRAAKPDAVFFFLPGGMGINFLKQYSQAGLSDKVPVFGPAFSFDERRMRAPGFPTYRYKLLCFAIAGAGAGLAGALIANQTEYVSPALLHWTRSGELLVMVILGGMGTLIGPVLGAITLLLGEDLLAIVTEYWQLYLGPFLVLVVLTTRRGIYGLIVGRHDRDGRDSHNGQGDSRD